MKYPFLSHTCKIFPFIIIIIIWDLQSYEVVSFILTQAFPVCYLFWQLTQLCLLRLHEVMGSTPDHSISKLKSMKYIVAICFSLCIQIYDWMIDESDLKNQTHTHTFMLAVQIIFKEKTPSHLQKEVGQVSNLNQWDTEWHRDCLTPQQRGHQCLIKWS